MGNKPKFMRPPLSDAFTNEASALSHRAFDGTAPIVSQIQLEYIHRNENQPRKHFDDIAIRELADSIEQKGLLQPIIVRKISGTEYQIIAGERRFRAHQLLERKSIDAIESQGDVDEIALIENMQRENLKPVELAEALARLIESHGYTHEVAAKMLGKSRGNITELLSINRVEPSIRAQCLTSDIASKSTLVELSRLSQDEQLSAWTELQAGTATVRNLRQKKLKSESAEIEANPGKKAKKVFATKHGVSVIIQAESPGGLSPEQIITALTDALKAAKKLGTEL